MRGKRKISCLPVALDLHLHPCLPQHHLAPVIDSKKINTDCYILLL